jgi:hypothetical protein
MARKELLLERIKKIREMTPEQRAAEKAEREAAQQEKIKALMEEFKARIAEQTAASKSTEK